MKVGQLIEYNMRNIYLEKSHVVGKQDSDFFIKKSKLSIILTKLFPLPVQVEVYQNILKLKC